MKKALLIIDVQEGLFNPLPDQAQSVISNLNLLIKKARIVNAPVIFIQHENATDLKYQSAEWQLSSLLDITADDIYVRKTTPDSFLGTNLQLILQQHVIETCIVGGYATEFCVDTTIRRAAALGYQIQLISDGHTTHDKDHAKAQCIRAHHNQTLINITSFGVSITAEKTQEIDF